MICGALGKLKPYGLDWCLTWGSRSGKLQTEEGENITVMDCQVVALLI